MSSVKSWHSLGGGDNSASRSLPPDVVKIGHHKKLKTMKKKFFVLREDSVEASARLEYYDSEKKFRTHQPAKRSITLKTCFNINKRSDTRQKYVIALYTKNDCFCIVLESEEEMEEWLKALLSLQQGEDVPDGELPKPTFEHVWDVNVQKKDLGSSRNILGPYHLCLTDRTLTLVKKGTEQKLEFSLQKIRSCGHLDSFFYMELGQATVTGAGNLWMQTEDTNIAQNMHAAILSAMTNCSKKGDLVPKSRNRSSSANEASKPITMMQRWPTHAEGSVKEISSVATSPVSQTESTHPHSGLTVGRDRCDSLPSRARTTSEGAHLVPHHTAVPRHLAPSHRPHSMYSRNISYSPPVNSSPVSPASGACSTNSAGSSLSVDGEGGEGGWGGLDSETRYGHSLTPDEPVILEENIDDYAPWQTGEDEKLNNYMVMDRFISLPIQNNSSTSRKYSPNTISGFKSSSPSQGSFIDMYSPCGSSPLETSGAYMPMSPGDIRAAYNRVSSTNHSRGSSLAEDGYVPMAPGTHEGYVDMDHGHSHASRGEVSSGSSCSITSGTPSTDIRFSEYNLERVSTLISQEEVTPTERPTRAYSVGSRPVNINNITAKCDVAANSEPQRVRAFSVGSRGPKARPVTHPHPHLTTPTRHSSHSSVEPSEDLMELDFSKNSKSRTRNKNIFKKPATSISSERLAIPSGSGVSSAASSYSTAEGSYMEMSPGSSPKPLDLDVDLISSPPKNTRYTITIGRSPPKSSYIFEKKMGYLSSSPPTNHASPPLYRVPEADSGYVEMTTGFNEEILRNDDYSAMSSSPKQCSNLKASLNKGEYMEMKPSSEAIPVLPKSTQPRVEMFPSPQQFNKVNNTPTIKQPLLTSQNMSRSRGSLPEDYLCMSSKRKLSTVEDNNNSKVVVSSTDIIETNEKTPEGYVEMSWSKNKSQRKASIEGGKSENEDYLNMTGSNFNRKDNKKCNRRDRNRYSSQPIAIQASNKDFQTNSPMFPFCARKHSAGTPPKIPCFLPLNAPTNTSPTTSPFSSLGRNRSRKTPRRDSRDSTSGSGLTTPSGSSSTIFPLNLNSPNSPIKPFAANQEKETSQSQVDASVGTSRLPQRTTCQQDCAVSSEMDYVNYVPGHNRPENPGHEYELIKPNFKTEDQKQIESTRKPPLDRLVADMSSLSLRTIPDESEVMSRLSEPSTSEGATGDSSAKPVSRSTEPSVVSRTSSISSVGEKELHYASLDLVRSSSEDDTGQARSLKSQTSLTESSSTSTPSPNPSADPSFTYAEIDFVASQKLLRH